MVETKKIDSKPKGFDFNKHERPIYKADIDKRFNQIKLESFLH